MFHTYQSRFLLLIVCVCVFNHFYWGTRTYNTVHYNFPAYTIPTAHLSPERPEYQGSFPILFPFKFNYIDKICSSVSLTICCSLTMFLIIPHMGVIFIFNLNMVTPTHIWVNRAELLKFHKNCKSMISW